ncbi:dTDP-fucopyranose mutase [anaerobic digester metagenome]
MGKIVVVGTGFSGTVVARRIAEDLNREVLVVEKRPHIAGNMYDERDDHGIMVQRYGPHVLVTDHWSIIKNLSRYATLIPHTVKELSYMDGNYVRLPFNFESIQQMIGPEKAEVLIGKLRAKFQGRDRVPVGELARDEDEDISGFGNLLFEKSYRTYCAKQWGIPTEQLDKSIIERVPMAMSYDERYMNKDFQYIPKEGFTALFAAMLNHPNITVRTGEDALDHLRFDEDSRTISYDGEAVELLVFTGALDELFGEKYGELPYRSLNITYDWQPQERVYPEAIISFPQADGYTRKTEYKFLTPGNEDAEGTTIATEYPVAYVKGGANAPFYSVITDETKARHDRYRAEAAAYKGLFYCGRLADFRYFNMDDCILHAEETFERIRTYLAH